MSPEQLNEVKTEVQKIIDRHLPEDQRFSIQDLDEEGTFLLIDLLLEKDDNERQKKRDKINKMVLNYKLDVELTYNSILEIKDKLDFQRNEVGDLDDLKKIIDADYQLDRQISKYEF